MLIHSNWVRDSLHVWGHTDDGSPLPSEALRAAVGEWTPDGLLASAGVDDALELWLPCADGKPALLTSAHPGELAPVLELCTQRLPTLRFDAAQTVDLLTSLSDPLPSNASDTIAFWGELARLVIHLVSSRRFYPDLVQQVEEHSVALASWKPLVSSHDELDRLERFAASMPQVCRAVVSMDDEPGAIVESFLTRTTDALIRRAVSNDEFFSRAHDKARESLAAPETRWMSGLLRIQPDRVVRSLGAHDLSNLVETVRSWVSRLDTAGPGAPVRLGVTLIEPDDDEADPAQDTLTTTDDAGRSTDDASAKTDGATDATDLATDATDVASDGTDTEPDDSAADLDAIWTLSFSLRPDEGNGDSIGAEELYEEGVDAAGILSRNVMNRRQQLLGELTRAGEICPLLTRALSMARPVSLRISTVEAHLFIRRWAGELKAHGVDVSLPDWAMKLDGEPGLLLSLRPIEGPPGDFGGSDPFDANAPRLDANGTTEAQLSTGRFGLQSLLEFDWRIAVGDLQLSPDEFRFLATRQSPLVRYKGRWIQLDSEAARKAVDFLEKRRSGTMTLAEAFRTALTTNRAEAGLSVLGMSGTSWVGLLLEQSPTQKINELPQPKEFGGTLRPYQLRGLEWLSFLDGIGLGGCLADDMGLGKTIQLIALMLHERREVLQRNGTIAAPAPASLGPTLLFSPTSVVGNWVRELARFAPHLKVLIHHGPERLRGDTFVNAANAADVVLTSYALAHRDLEDFKKPAWRRLALDEAQKIKNPFAASTMAIRSLVAPRRVALTGTPIENHLSELWSIMEVLNPGLLGGASDFRERFAVPIEKLGDRDRAEQLRRLIRPFVLRRTKADPAVAGDLPEKLEMKVFCNLTPEQAQLYQQITTDMLNRVENADGIRRRGLILAGLTRLKQVCDHPQLVLPDDKGGLEGRSGKCERLVEMLEEIIEAGDAALVFTQYRTMGHLLEKAIADRLRVPTLFLHGGTPAGQRDTMITRFQSGTPDAPRIFILSLRAGGLGLNLTAANHVFHFDRWWNPAVESQATDRAHRIGQTRTVQVHKFVCVGTMEERIDKLLSDKLALADKIVGSGDEWLTSLSTEQLKEYLQLSPDAVGEF